MTQKADTGSWSASGGHCRAQISGWQGMLREIEADQAFILERYEKLTEPSVRERLAALGGSIGGLQYELSEVKDRLGELQAAVGSEHER